MKKRKIIIISSLFILLLVGCIFASINIFKTENENIQDIENTTTQDEIKEDQSVEKNDSKEEEKIIEETEKTKTSENKKTTSTKESTKTTTKSNKSSTNKTTTSTPTKTEEKESTTKEWTDEEITAYVRQTITDFRLDYKSTEDCMKAGYDWANNYGYQFACTHLQIPDTNIVANMLTLETGSIFCDGEWTGSHEYNSREKIGNIAYLRSLGYKCENIKGDVY